jgi:hypothetical protein
VRLSGAFLPVADEVSRLQSSSDAEGRFFQTIAEQGHYAGRTRPTSTRQGTYAFTPAGRFLGSINTTDPARMAQMLRAALSQWEQIPSAEMRSGRMPDADRPERRFPVGGLNLRVTVRDLPREGLPDDWRGRAWNNDFVWVTREEAASIAASPETPLRDAGWLAHRLARLHFVDFVRGQTGPYADGDVVRAELSVEQNPSDEVDSESVAMTLTGETATWAEGIWTIAGDRGDEPEQRRRGIRLRLRGHARWDRTAARFACFRMVALGTRLGATKYNVRTTDPGPAPIGYLLEMAGEGPDERVAPAFHREYVRAAQAAPSEG